MIQYNYFDHVTPQETKYTDWLQALGWKYTIDGENMAYNLIKIQSQKILF